MCNKDKLSQQFLEVAQKALKKFPDTNINTQLQNTKIQHPYAFAQGTALKCKDQCVAVIKIDSGGISFDSNYIPATERNKANQSNKCDLPVIALVIESPHKNEFFDKKTQRTTPFPAMGTTGENIEKHILGNLAKYCTVEDNGSDKAEIYLRPRLAEGKYRLYLVNAVQYQCSLGKLDKKSNAPARKNHIVNEFFKEYGKNCFVKRLKKLHPKIIINCCTIGDGYRNRDMVQEVINEKFACCQRMTGYHPAYLLFAKGFNTVK